MRGGRARLVAALLCVGPLVLAPSAHGATVAVALRHPDAAGERRVLAALYDPRSPSYHHFLSPAAFARRFGVASHTVESARAWLQHAGLSVDYVSRSGDYLLASGSAAQARRLGSAPARLPVLGLLGLDSRQQHRPASAQRPLQNPDVGARTPQDLWSVYQQPAQYLGRGVSVGIIGVGETDTVITNLHEFDKTQGLPTVPVRVVHTPEEGDYSDTSVYGEWYLDVTAVHGMAPELAQEVLYASPTYADTQLVASLARWVNDASGPLVMNESFGECEPAPANAVLTDPALAQLDGNEHPDGGLQLGLANSAQPVETQILQQAVMEGRTLFASAGDAGAGCAAVYAGPIGAGNGLIPFIDGLTEDPADLPFSVGVGGTVLYTDGNTPAQRSLEYAWTHGGGGASPFIAAPDYQQDVANLVRLCVASADGSPGNTGKLCRGVPDVAALSGDILTNGYVTGGGTSLSAPLWAGMWARVIQSSGGGGYGFANEAIYKVAKDPQRYARSFYDVTQGANGSPALAGWDYATGWGTPNLGGLIADIRATTPARPVPAGPGAPAPAPCSDGMRPRSRAVSVRLTRRRVSIRGTASDRGCGPGGQGVLLRERVAVARLAGRRCRYLRSNGRFGPAASCGRPRYLVARGTGSWRLTLSARLPRGRYAVFVQAIDAAGNRERAIRRSARMR